MKYNRKSSRCTDRIIDRIIDGYLSSNYGLCLKIADKVVKIKEMEIHEKQINN